MSSDASAPFGSCPIPIADATEVLMAHGSGGKLSAQLIERMLVPALRNEILERLDDQALLTVEPGGALAFTTDSYVVTPIFFPGGDIGELAVNGTVNDLAVGGAVPKWLSLSLILEEGLPLAELERVVGSIARAATAAGVQVVTGDTKVVNRGKGDKVFINTAGIGLRRQGVSLSSARVRAGDVVLLSGTVGDHGVAILSQREGLTFDGELRSDTAPLHGLVEAMLEAFPDVHAMRDPTRGGVAATLVEISTRQRLGIELDEAAVPMNEAVRGACEMLGLDPLLVANEGKLIAFVPEEGAERVLEAMRAHPLGRQAARVGRVVAEHPGMVIRRTRVGGKSLLDLPFGEALPRIC